MAPWCWLWRGSPVGGMEAVLSQAQGQADAPTGAYAGDQPGCVDLQQGHILGMQAYKVLLVFGLEQDAQPTEPPIKSSWTWLCF